MATFHCPKWGSCDCPTGTVRADCPGLLDRRNVIVFDGEHLSAEKAWANRPFRFTPRESFWIIAVTLIATGAALYAANAAQGVPV